MPMLFTSLPGLMATKVEASLFDQLSEELQRMLLMGILGADTALIDSIVQSLQQVP